MGSAVDKKNIDYNLQKYQEAGIGGLHIVPIYGVVGEENKYIDYLSPDWVEMLAYTSQECRKLGLGLDMTLGTGWCFGGPAVDEQTGSMLAYLDKIHIKGGSVDIDLNVKSPYPSNRIQSVLAVYNDGTRIDLSDKVSEDQRLIWSTPQDSLVLYIIRMQGPVFNVKRPAPGGEGFMLDPFSPSAMNTYTARFDAAFQGPLKQYVRSIYHDSYEYKADWTHDLFEIFKQRRGYDLRLYVPELVGDGTETSRRIIADYRQTMSELHEEFITEVSKWAEANGVVFRNQGHGSPANWLDIYALADIPETETFGATPFKIQGLTREEAFINNDRPNRFVLKFASSAAHVMGKPLTSSETNTWLREHFRVALSHSKPELDQLFLSGINHIFYHGIAYSPREADWPGWQFYASTSFAPTNSIFHHFSALNQYAERCQEVLRSGEPDNEILLYFPVQDVWHSPGPVDESMINRATNQSDVRTALGVLYRLTAHNYEDWLVPFPVYEAARALDSLGYAFDYISDRQLLQSTTANNLLSTAGNNYKALVVPRCEHMPVETMKAIQKLADHGGKVIFLDNLPLSVPGHYNWQHRQSQLEELNAKISGSKSENLKVIELKRDDGLLKASLSKWDVKNEYFSEYGLPFIRRKTDEGYVYFISNIYSGQDVNDFVPLGIDATDAVILDPLSGKVGKALLKKNDGSTSIMLQLETGQSIMIKTFRDRTVLKEKWHYIRAENEAMPIAGTWKVEFIEGGPVLPPPITTDQLKSWTEFGGKEAERFAGTARYTIEFTMNDLAADDYLINFEEVRESAAIQINDHALPVLFSHPFKTSIGQYLKKGKNKLVIDVTNLSANRVRDLDIRGNKLEKIP